MIKFFAWEDSFVERIDEVRNREIGLLKYENEDLHLRLTSRTYLYLNTGSNSLWGAIPILLAVICFLIYTAMGHDLDAATAFSSLCSLYRKFMNYLILTCVYSFDQHDVASFGYVSFVYWTYGSSGCCSWTY